MYKFIKKLYYSISTTKKLLQLMLQQREYSLTIKLFEQAKQDAAICCQYRSKYQGYNGHQFD